MDLSKFSKAVAKSVEGLNASMGFRDPKLGFTQGTMLLITEFQEILRKDFPLRVK